MHHRRTRPPFRAAAPLLAWVLAFALAACAPSTPDVVADAGADRTVDVGAVVVLDGGASRPVGELAFEWGFDERPAGSGAVLASPDAAVATFVADAPGTFVVRLRASRGGRAAEATVAITAAEAPGVLLEGPAETLAALATRSLFVPAIYPATAYAALPSGGTVLLREVEARFRLDATVGAVNDLLGRYGATIVAMTGGTPVVVLRVPDPGDVAGLEDLLARLAAESIVEAAHASVVIEPPLDPRDAEPPGPAGIATAAVPNDIPLDDPRMLRVDHHLAVRAHAAWRAVEAAGETPTLLILDFFGAGAPTDGYAATFTAADYATGDAHSHGYHVLGIAIGAQGDGGASGVDRADVTGMSPLPAPTRAVDLQLPTMNTGPRIRQRAIQLLVELVAADPGARAVVNSSIGAIDAFGDQRSEGESWVVAVRLAFGSAGTTAELIAQATTPGSGLEPHFVHATTAGNAASDTSGAVALQNHPFTYAALGTDMTVSGVPLPPLRNVLVVENRVRFRHDARSDLKPDATCASSDSTMGGNLSAIGSWVWSFGRCTARNANGDCIAHTEADAEFKSGTSMAAPQVAGLALYGWALAPDLDAIELAALLRTTALPDVPDTARTFCSTILPQPVIDAYALALATGGVDAWRAILDVVGDAGVFDQFDVQALRDALADRASRFVTYGRADLDGDGVVGNLARRQRVDLDGDGGYGFVTRQIAGRNRAFDERALNDLDVLCAQAYGPAYQGLPSTRNALLDVVCDEFLVRIELPAAGGTSFGLATTLRARLLDPRDPANEVADPSGALTLRWHAALPDGTRVPLAVTRPGESRPVGLPCSDAVVAAIAWRDGVQVGRDGVRLEARETRSPAVPRIASPGRDPVYANASLAGATVALQAAGTQWTCAGPENVRSSGFVWRDATTQAVLATGPTLTLAVDALPGAGVTVRLEHLDGPGFVDVRTVIPCRPLLLPEPLPGLAACGDTTLADRFAAAFASVVTGWDDAARARADLEDALRAAFLGEPPDPFPTPRAALLSGVVGILGEAETTPIAWLLNLLDAPPADAAALRQALVGVEVDAAGFLADAPAVLEVVQVASQAAWAALAAYAPPPEGTPSTGGSGWDAFRYATGEALVGVSAAPIARVAAYAYLTAFVERYGAAGDFGEAALELEQGLAAAAVGAALAAEFLVAP
jgi:hypothetical protein